MISLAVPFSQTDFSEPISDRLTLWVSFIIRIRSALAIAIIYNRFKRVLETDFMFLLISTDQADLMRVGLHLDWPFGAMVAK